MSEGAEAAALDASIPDLDASIPDVGTVALSPNEEIKVRVCAGGMRHAPAQQQAQTQNTQHRCRLSSP